MLLARKNPAIRSRYFLSTIEDRHRSLIERESRVGSSIFGSVPFGSKREFFCLDEKTWVWREKHNTKDGKVKVINTRYVIYQDRIDKIQNSEPSEISLDEIENLLHAMQVYTDRVAKKVYRKRNI